MSTAKFTNFSKEEFIGYWDGKPKKFAPGQSVHMPDYLARHFAKHLVNRELLRRDSNGNLIHKDGEKMTSPKRPDDVPVYMQLFNKAYEEEKTEEEKEAESQGQQGKGDDVDTLINSVEKNYEQDGSPKTPNQPESNVHQSDDADTEDSFGGQPVEQVVASGSESSNNDQNDDDNTQRRQ